MISVHFQGKLFNITVIQVYAPISNAKEAEVELFYEDLQDLLEHSKKDVLFIIGDWNAKVGSQETPPGTPLIQGTASWVSGQKRQSEMSKMTGGRALEKRRCCGQEGLWAPFYAFREKPKSVTALM